LLSLRNVLVVMTLLAGFIPALFGINYVLRPDTLPVQKVSFEGPFKHVSKAELARAVAPVVAGNLLLLDLDAIKARAESVPWVYQVSVRRQWPDGVHIRFTEQTLAAQWGGTLWINTTGDLVNLQGRHGPSDLPRLNGPDGTQAEVFARYQQLNALLAPAGLPIASLTLTARHTWRTVVDRNLLLVLGHHALNAKVTRFLTVYTQALENRRKWMRRVDLRYSNGFAVQWQDHAGAENSSGAEG
ncbi:MAG: cell division protein FtsQ/DivIB, partial [Acidiferrobacterales bacterium]